MEHISIGTIAKRAGIRPSAIRYYESAGILEPPARQGGQRRYATNVLVDLAVIGRARELGFSISEIRELFRAFPDSMTASERWHALARRKIAEMDAVVARAEAIRAMLGESLACGCDAFDHCPMLADDARPGGSVR